MPVAMLPAPLCYAGRLPDLQSVGFLGSQGTVRTPEGFAGPGWLSNLSVAASSDTCRTTLAGWIGRTLFLAERCSGSSDNLPINARPRHASQITIFVINIYGLLDSDTFFACVTHFSAYLPVRMAAATRAAMATPPPTPPDSPVLRVTPPEDPQEPITMYKVRDCCSRLSC